jgi:hypothetical protein
MQAEARVGHVDVAVATAGVAVLAAGAVLLALMLKRSDVEGVDVDEPASAAA